MSRRLLVIAYYFPPLGGVGVQRTLRFVTHLPASGWQPVVVAPRGAAYRSRDPALLNRLAPKLEIHRAWCVEPAGLRALARRALDRVRAGRTPTLSGSDSASIGAPPAGRPPHGRARNWLDAAWRTWVRTLFIPDEQMAWVPVAAWVGRRAHRRNPVAVIYSSSPPPSAHLAAGLVKSLTGRPWVADFRDPWVGNASAVPRSAVHERAERWLERWVVRKADRVVFATPTLRHRYAASYPARAWRFRAIPNGYDGAELASVARPAARSDGLFRLAYTGSIYGEHELRIFLDGLAIALDRRPALRERLRVDFYGWMTAPNERLLAERASHLGPVVVGHGFVPHAEAVAGLLAADAGLVLLAPAPGRDVVVPAKLYEYLGLDRQVLAVVPEGDTRRILEELDWGIVADPEPAAVADGLLRLVEATAPNRPADPEGHYDRRRQAAALASILDEVAGEKP